MNAIFFVSWKKNSILVLVLFLASVTEITTIRFNFQWIFVLYFFLNFVLWFFILFRILNFNILHSIIILFTCFNIFAILFFGKKNYLNNYSFVLGTIIYVITLIFHCVFHIKQEEYEFFSSNEFILLLSPVIFFLGMSFLLGFNSYNLLPERVFGNIKLYYVINYSANFIYYSLINLYIYKEYKRNHV